MGCFAVFFFLNSSESHVFCCGGMGPDFRVLVRKSRKQAEQYHRLYKEPIPVTQLVRETAAVMQESEFKLPNFITLSLILITQRLSSYVPASSLVLMKKVYGCTRYLDNPLQTMCFEVLVFTHTSSSFSLTIYVVLTPAEIDDYLAEGIDIVFFGSSGVLPCIDTNRDTCVTFQVF
ncbi:hypothetical protein DKX38_018982 [Salix brachista]|uniref:Proteasome alpha-type subunits domain-containing protein n=1 Tax=Salix brachista TaxID=2182728 RepID=A0A5N5KPI0_9ROSI|nr:hypothetical protein DKX38_018982 [Salix brachista]